MYFCSKPRFIFLANPKTATRSILHHLRSKGLKLEREGVGHGWQLRRKREKWPSFTVVRHPYDRMFSLWWTARHQPRSKGMGFEEFLRTTHRPQFRFAQEAQYVLRFEDLQAGLESLPFWPGGTLPHHNSSSQPRPRTIHGLKRPAIPAKEEFLTPEIKKLIRKRYRRDFVELGYAD